MKRAVRNSKKYRDYCSDIVSSNPILVWPGFKNSAIVSKEFYDYMEAET